MRAPVGLVLILPLAIIMTLPTHTIPVDALTQNGPLTWSPFGPRVDSIIINVYGDFQAMFNAFLAGQVDITDWPVPPSDLASYASNPDFFLSEKVLQGRVRGIEINHHNPFMGIAQQQTRILGPTGLRSTTITSGCSVGFARLNVVLDNLEESNATVVDSLNRVTIAGPQSFTITDQDDGNLDGTYVFASTTRCVLTGSYTITPSLYIGSASLFIGSGQVVTAHVGVNYDSPSTVKPTKAGIELRRGLSHLVDKQGFVRSSVLQGEAEYVDIHAAPRMALSIDGEPYSKLPQSVVDVDCGYHSWFQPSNCHVVSAYNLQADNIAGAARWWGLQGGTLGADFGYSGTDDIRAACDHFVLAGFQIADASDPEKDDCLELAEAANSPVVLSTYPHLAPTGQIQLYIRTSPPDRKAFGQIVADSLNLMFGTPNNQGPFCTVLYGNTCTPTYYTISQISNIVFSAENPDDWNLYGAEFPMGSIPDHLWALYHSSFASDFCGGPREIFPNNYNLYCNPSFDSATIAAMAASTVAEALSFWGRAALVGHETVMSVPMYSPSVSQYVALNGWNFQPGTKSSLVSELVLGFQLGFWSMLNMRTLPGYAPTDTRYRPGDGNPNLIRRGFSQEVYNLSPFTAVTTWDFEVISSIFDSMLALSPVTGFSGLEALDWSTVSHISSFNPTEVSCVGANCFTGTTTQTWRLRNDLRFHDGQQVTAADVAYSIIAYRDVPSSSLQGQVSSVSSAIALNTVTLQVKLQGRSPYFEMNIGTVPIIPKRVWAPICGDPPSPLSPCAYGSGFDPMAAGIMIGHGPWVCKHIQTGVVGGSCSQNADNSVGTQDVVAGGRIKLTANNDYMRGRPGVQGGNLHRFSFADKNNDGIVSLLDIADAALHFAQPNDYWDSPLFGVVAGTVDIGEIATVAFYYDHGLTKPFTPSTVTGLDPCIDPFFQSFPPC